MIQTQRILVGPDNEATLHKLAMLVVAILKSGELVEFEASRSDSGYWIIDFVP